MAQIREVRAKALEQIVALSKDYLEITAPESQQQLEDRQHYERLNFERQQDEQLKSLMNQVLNQQTQHASSTMGILQELDSFFVMLSRRLYGISTEDEIEEQ
jgi:hypothetical protein